MSSTLLSILLHDGFIDSHIHSAITYSNDNIIKALINNGVTFDTITKTLFDNFDISYFNIIDTTVTSDILETITYNIAYKYTVFPIKIVDDKLYISMENPLDLKAIDDIRMITDFDVIPMISKSDDIKTCITTHYGKDKIDNISSEFLLDNNFQKLTDNTTVFKNDNISMAPVVKLLDSLLENAILLRASDIHIEPYDKIIRTRYRIDGVLKEFDSINIFFLDTIISRLKIVSNLDISEKRFPQEGHFKINKDNQNIEFRVSTVPTIFGEKAVIRVFYTSNKILSLNKLGFFEEDIKKINSMLNNPHGAILLTGPTGSGKTTSLYTFLNQLNNGKVNIVTIEDPVENIIFGITQININRKVSLDFDNILDYILRQDPDIIMIGEIRNAETAKMAIRASITGHLVLSTLHTNDSISTITRLINMNVEKYIISDGVRGIIAQRLVRRLCEYCKAEYLSDNLLLKTLNIPLNTKLYKETGCSRCQFTGFKGRFAVYEILQIDDFVKQFIIGDKSLEELKHYLLSIDFSYIKDSLSKNLILGKTSQSEVLRLLI